jgi:hypothetical protein
MQQDEQVLLTDLPAKSNKKAAKQQLEEVLQPDPSTQN